MNEAAFLLVGTLFALCIAVLTTPRDDRDAGLWRALFELVAVSVSVSIGTLAWLRLCREATGLAYGSYSAGVGPLLLVLLGAPRAQRNGARVCAAVRDWRPRLRIWIALTVTLLAAACFAANRWLPEVWNVAYPPSVIVGVLTGVGLNVLVIRRLRHHIAAAPAPLQQLQLRDIRREVNGAVWGVAIAIGLVANLMLTFVVSGQVDSISERLATIVCAVIFFGALGVALWSDRRGIAFAKVSRGTSSRPAALPA